VISANSKTNKTDLMVPFVAPECGRISQITRLKTEVSLLVRERFIKFNLMVSTDCEPTSTPRIRVLVNQVELPHVEHLGRCRHGEWLRATSQLGTDRCSSRRCAAGYWRSVLCTSGLFIIRMMACSLSHLASLCGNETSPDMLHCITREPTQMADTQKARRDRNRRRSSPPAQPKISSSNHVQMIRPRSD